MGIPARIAAKVGWYVMKNRLLMRKRYPLVLMLEPLLACNLACKGCGKIQHPAQILRQRMSAEECEQAVVECGAPVVSIAGGEPLIHKEIHDIVERVTVKQNRFTYLCTNGLPLEKKIDEFKPNNNLIFSLHLDGMRETHDRSVCKEGVFDTVVDLIKELKSRGFLVATNTTIFDDHTVAEMREFLNYMTDLKVDMCMISPGYAYEKAPDQQHFLARERTKQFFRALLDKPEKRWPLNQSRFYLEFLMGQKEYECTPWGNPLRTVFGWQRPCYLMASDLEEPYVPSFKQLMEETNWDLYGTGKHDKCAQCMAHCGYEASAVSDTVKHPLNMILGGWPTLPKPKKKLLQKDREAALMQADAPAPEVSAAASVASPATTAATPGCGNGSNGGCSSGNDAEAVATGSDASTSTNEPKSF